MIKPVFFVDLDDNLFQTSRKINKFYKNECTIAALDRQYKPRSFFTLKQSNYLQWLLVNSEVIPVTARGTEEISRVAVNFMSWKIITHGAVIQKPCGEIDYGWQEIITTQLHPYQIILHKMQEELTKLFEVSNVNAWARINYEYNGVAVFLAAKHSNNKCVKELYDVVDKFNTKYRFNGFYMHRNDNNIALIPRCIEKGIAVKYLLKKLKTEELGVPVVGLGDSISDHKFLRQCDWFGMPKKGQITTLLNDEIDKLEQVNE
ncbi:hypothetical protein [Vibrio owensii]|nr:hypothetical protein [Vibrio owensii]